MPHALTFADLSLQAISLPRNLILMEIWTSQLTFLCGPSVCVIPFLSNLTLVCYLQASNGNPAAQQVINSTTFCTNDATMLIERLFTLIRASDTLYLI
jgi:F0F1-type ATP synthase assembly protein I